MEYYHYCASPLGILTLRSNGRTLTGLFIGCEVQLPNLSGCFDAPNAAEAVEAADIFTQTERWLREYFAGSEPGFTPPLSLNGTAFQKAVWEILLTIPYAQTVSYGEIARKIAAARGIERMSARAVGAAVGRNPIALIVPCHRVIGADGSLTGYAYGVDRKKRLLELETKDR